MKPGLSAIIATAAKNFFFRCKEEKGYPIKEDQFTAAGQGLWRMRLERGVFLCGMGGCEFHLEAAEDWVESFIGKYPVSMGYDEVVRIEGDSGELWQNVDYNWDGSPKSS